MTNFAQYLADQHAKGRQDEIAVVAGIWVTMSDGKARSVSGIRKWFDEHADQIPVSTEQYQVGLQHAVAEYTSQRDGSQPPQVTIPQTLTDALAEVRERMDGMERALVWIVDAISGQAAASALAADPRSPTDYREWAGGDATRSEAAALGLVTPAPGRVSREFAGDPHLRGAQPGYEHVMPPTTETSQQWAQPPLVEHSEPPERVEAMQQGEYQPSADPGNFYYDHGPGSPPGQQTDLADAIAAEAARIQASAGDDEVAYYDESAAVQPVAPPAGYSPEQWRAWAMVSDIPDGEQQ